MNKQRLEKLLSKIESSMRYDMDAYNELSEQLAIHNPFKDDTIISLISYETATKFLLWLDTSDVFVILSKWEGVWHCRFIDGNKSYDEGLLGSCKHASYSIAIWGAYLEWQYLLAESETA